MAANLTELRHALMERLRDEFGDEILTYSMSNPGLASAGEGRLPMLVLRAESFPVDTGEHQRPPVWRMRMALTVYLDTGRETDDPDARLEAVIARVERALEKRPGEHSVWWTTLGGLCVAAYPTDEADVSPTDSGQAFVQIPLEILKVTPRPGISWAT